MDIYIFIFYLRRAWTISLCVLLALNPYIVLYFLLIWFTPPPKHRRHSSLNLQHHPSLQPSAPPSFSPKQPTPPTSAKSFDWVLKIVASLKVRIIAIFVIVCLSDYRLISCVFRFDSLIVWSKLAIHKEISISDIHYPVPNILFPTVSWYNWFLTMYFLVDNDL